MTTTDEAVEQVRRDPSRLERVFPAAGRQAVREGLSGDEARSRLLLALTGDPASVGATIARVYRQGDPSEKRAVLLALPLLDADDNPCPLGDVALPLVRDALRSNDTGLVSAAMGPYAARHLEPPAWRQGVLKLVFMGVSVRVVSGLTGRADAELARMAGDFADERRAAGRDVPTDVGVLIAAASGAAASPGA